MPQDNRQPDRAEEVDREFLVAGGQGAALLEPARAALAHAPPAVGSMVAVPSSPGTRSAFCPAVTGSMPRSVSHVRMRVALYAFRRPGTAAARG